MGNRGLSVIIIAKEEEEMIEDCLKSVKWVDEIVVVVDDRTTDKTAKIAKKYSNKVFLKKFESFGKQKQFALDKATKDWVLSLDADERVTPELKNEILDKIKKAEFDGFLAFRQVVFLGKKLSSYGMRIQGTIRLFKKNKARFLPLKIHERVEVKGKIGQLENYIIHHSHRTVFQTMEKLNRFSSLEAEELYEISGRTNLLFIFIAPFFAFFREYFFHYSFRHGVRGVLMGLFATIYYLMKHIKMWELQKNAQKNKDFIFPEEVEGYISAQEGRLLYQLAQANPRLGRVVELGSYQGRSTICLAQASKKVNGGKILTVDTFLGDISVGRQPSYFGQFKQNIRRYRLGSYVSVFRGETSKAAESWQGPIRFLFIDASHFYEDVLEDYQAWEKYLVPGSIIAFHDSHWPGVYDFVCQLIREGKIKDWKTVYKKKSFGRFTYGYKPSPIETMPWLKRYYSWLKFKWISLPESWSRFKQDVNERGRRNKSDLKFRFFGTLAYCWRKIKAIWLRN